MSRPESWEAHWPSDDELLGRAVVYLARDAAPQFRWMLIKKGLSVGSTLAQALVDRYVADDGSLKL